MRIALACLICLFVTLPALAIDLPLKARVQVEGTQVGLRDLLSASDRARLDKLAGPIRLFTAPEPGMKRQVSRQTLARLVGRQIDTDQLRLTGADKVTIIRKGIWIEPAEVQTVLEDYLHSAAAKMPGVDLRFEKLYLPPRFMVAVGKVEYQVIPANPQVIGSRSLTLITRVNGKVVANRNIRASIKASAQVVVTVTDMKRGKRLAASDLVLQQVDISHLEKPFFTIDQLLGKRLKQSLRSGQPLQRRQVEFPPLIKRGELVTIEVRGRGLRLTASGEARQNGELGETIRVRNSRSQRIVLCRVKASGLVSVGF